MGIRYQRRINLGDGYGLNLSKSGISSSYRTKYGSVGPRGFSIRTGIPGLSFRSNFGKSKKGDGAFIILMVLMFIGALIITAIVLWNIALFLKWSTEEIFKLIIRERRKYKLRKEVALNKDSTTTKYINFTNNNFPLKYAKTKFLLEDILIENGSEVRKGNVLAIVAVGDQHEILKSDDTGKITFYKTPGEKLKIGDYLYKIEKKV